MPKNLIWLKSRQISGALPYVEDAICIAMEVISIHMVSQLHQRLEHYIDSIANSDK